MRWWLLACVMVVSMVTPVAAEELLMVRVKHDFPETMLKFQEIIKQHGYTLSRVQRVDIGLSNMGYKTDKYRIVFFGKEDQNRWIIEHHPELIPYLPLKVAIYSEDQDTLMVAANLEVLFNPEDPKLKQIVNGWQHDLQGMFQEMHKFGLDN